MENSCVFCDPEKMRERLVYENEHYYVVATLGQIVSGYVIIVPKAHISCFGVLPIGSAMRSLVTTIYLTQRALNLEYIHDDSLGALSKILMFEHGIVGQTVKHAHLHLLPVKIDLTKKIATDFPKAKITNLSDGDSCLQDAYSRNQEPYLFWTTPSGDSMVCWNPPAPSMYLRLITAELLGSPERGNWRDMDRATDNNLLDETVRRLKPYFE